MVPMLLQYWKSNAMYWCDLCKCWMNDTKAAKLNHERGAKHQENLEKSELPSRQQAAGNSAGQDGSLGDEQQHHVSRPSIQAGSGCCMLAPRGLMTFVSCFGPAMVDPAPGTKTERWQLRTLCTSLHTCLSGGH